MSFLVIPSARAPGTLLPSGRSRPAASGLTLFLPLLFTSAFACSGTRDEQGNGATTGQTSSATSEQEQGETSTGIELAEEDDGEEDDGCQRELSLATLQVGNPAPFDVIIVADHSGSISWSREDLAAGLSDLLQQVQGHEVRFFVLTPTQYGEGSQDAQWLRSNRDYVQWRDPATDLPYDHAVTDFSRSCVDGTGQSIICPERSSTFDFDVTATGAWSFTMPAPVAVITQEMSDSELTIQQTAISEAILGLGYSGSSYEQPVCTLQRYIHQEASLLPQHALFLLLSDEDDTSEPNDCVATVENKLYAQEARLYYSLSGARISEVVRTECTPVNDKGEATGDPHPHSLYRSTNCTVERSCTPEDTELAERYCEANEKLTKCSVICESGTGSLCSLAADGVVGDPCAGAFTYQDQSYGSLFDYCQTLKPEITQPTECRSFESSGSLAESTSLEPLLRVNSMSEFVRSFRAQADTRFAEGSYSVQLIGFDPTFTCLPQAGQSYLSNLKGLVDSDSQIFPICEDYSAALGQAKVFANQLVEGRYPLALKAGESVRAVIASTASGGERTLPETTYSYDEYSGTLLIQPGFLTVEDKELSIAVSQDCLIR